MKGQKVRRDNGDDGERCFTEIVMRTQKAIPMRTVELRLCVWKCLLVLNSQCTRCQIATYFNTGIDMKLIINSSDLQNIQHIEYRTSKHTHTQHTQVVTSWCVLDWSTTYSMRVCLNGICWDEKMQLDSIWWEQTTKDEKKNNVEEIIYIIDM